jgi:hypothetical protein
MPNDATTWAICHYEDEPHKIDFPELIEIALFQHPDFSETDIESDPAQQNHVIRFTYRGNEHVLHYLLRYSVQDMRQTLAQIEPPCRVILSMMDLSVGNAADREEGAYMVKERLEESADETIWMVTGYPVEAKRILEELGLDVRIVAKPPNHRQVRDEIVELLLDAISSLGK